MKSKSQRVGRKAKSGVKRHPGGQIVDATPQQQQENAMQVAVEARQRIHGLTKAAAESQEGGTSIGRLWLEGRLGPKHQAKDLVEAAAVFRERRFAADQAMGVSRLSTSTNYVDGCGGYDGSEGDEPDYVNRCNRARSRYAELRRAVLECGDGMAMIAIETAVIDDRSLIGDAMVGSLRCGLNAVHRVLQYDRKAA